MGMVGIFNRKTASLLLVIVHHKRYLKQPNMLMELRLVPPILNEKLKI